MCIRPAGPPSPRKLTDGLPARCRMFNTDQFFADVDRVIASFGEADRPRARQLIAELETIAARVPRSAELCHAYQARLYVKLEEFEQALIAVEKARLLMPLDDTLLILRGDIHRAAEEYGRALRDYGQVLQERPDSVTALMRRADMHQAQGQHAAALLDLEAALRHEPRSLRLIYRRGLVLVDLGRVAEAIAAFRSVARQSPASDLKRKARARLHELGTTDSDP